MNTFYDEKSVYKNKSIRGHQFIVMDETKAVNARINSQAEK